MFVRSIAISFAISVALFGCSDAKRPVFELADRDYTLSTGTNVLKIAQMQSNDVIVAVNGYPLTKGMYDMAVSLKQWMLMREKGRNQFEISKIAEDFSVNYPRNFMMQRLLIDEAFARGVVTTNEVEEFVAAKLKESAKIQKTTPKAIERKFGRAAPYMKYEQAVAYIMGRFIDKCIPPEVEVDDAFAEATHQRVLAENAAASATNAMKRAQLEGIRQKILSGELTFEKARNDKSDALGEDHEDGIWGDFEKGDFDNPAMAQAIFETPEGGLTEVLEDDDYFEIVKVISVVDDSTGNAADSEAMPQKRTLSRIALKKEPLFVVLGHDDLVKDLKEQMQLRAVDKFVSDLITNGVNKIVYPNGVRLF